MTRRPVVTPRRFAFALTALLAAGAHGRAAADTVIVGGNLGNQTWTPTGNPYVIQGDVAVQAGATLTIAAGTQVLFAAGDSQAGGQDPTQAELIVGGTLTVGGTAAMPVTFRSQNGTTAESWYGIRALAGAQAVTIDHAVILHSSFGVTSYMTASPLVLRHATVNRSLIAVVIAAGSGTLSDIVALENQTMIWFGAASGSITNALLGTPSPVTIGAGGYGVLVVQPTAPVHIVNCTIDGMQTGIASSNATQPIDVVNSIVTNGNDGVYGDGIVTVSTPTSGTTPSTSPASRRAQASFDEPAVRQQHRLSLAGDQRLHRLGHERRRA